jgi:fatty acid desaturase
MSDDEAPGLPTVVWLAIAVLVVIGLFTIVGWVFSAVWTLVRLAVVLLVVLAVVAVVRASRRDS